MSEPRITLVKEEGLTFPFAGLVVFRASKILIDQVLSKSLTHDVGSFKIIGTYWHEIVHYIQSISTSYLLNHSTSLLYLADGVLKGIADPDQPDKSRRFAVISRLIAKRTSETDLSPKDILEGVAFVESFKLTDSNPTIDRFLEFRDRYYPGDGESYYRRTFDYLQTSSASGLRLT